MASPNSPTRLVAPESSSTVRVRMIDTTALLTIKSESFVKPVIKGHELINVTDVAFLIENEATGKRVLFDAGVRKDYWNLPMVIQRRLGDVIPSLRVDKDITEILEEASIQLPSIGSIIWSHYHWDHVGNVSLFPPTTSITVGPGFKSHPLLLPGYPTKSDSPVSASDFANRTLTEISFGQSDLKIGALPAYDYFGDGSFYLLDTPGHCVGHICGLARTTSSSAGSGEDSFVFMGGDISHFPGVYRPNAAYPLPDPIPDSQSILAPSLFPHPCPCSLFTDLFADPPSSSSSFTTDKRSHPFYSISTHPKSAYIDPATASASADLMRQNFEQAPNVLVCIAHDTSLVHGGVLPLLNRAGQRDEDLNGWLGKGWKTDPKVMWGWLGEMPTKEGREGRGRIVDGFWRGGERWAWEGRGKGK